ncbi:uncharacterized protein BP5553_10420 [Venustampulla echinocandica]|uniref:Uncharacterized protein n=1 Tax=Venustampulla echinocandica TaxID=2656787 RepID=A0A370T995_9HELO|nr:uncharacterized protein BP5553_10420 [Venustampulla echinocandica]RDL30142.1 hypothetical protein BP5553_10420 [Venustampulla echinocandica]
MAKKYDLQRPRRESAPSPPEETPKTNRVPKTPAFSPQRPPPAVAGPSTTRLPSSSRPFGIHQGPIPPPYHEPIGAPGPSRGVSYADALRSCLAHPTASVGEKRKGKAIDDSLGPPRRRARKTSIEEEVIEGINEVRRRQSAEFGEMRERPDPTNPDTPPKQITPPPRFKPKYPSKYCAPILDLPDGVGDDGDSDDSDEALSKQAGNLTIRRTALDLLSPLGNRISSFINFRPYIQGPLSPYRTRTPVLEAQKVDAATNQHQCYPTDSSNSSPLGSDGSGFSNIEAPVAPPGLFIEDNNQPWPKETDPTICPNQAIDLSASLPTAPSRRPHRPTSSTGTEDGSSSSSGSG